MCGDGGAGRGWGGGHMGLWLQYSLMGGLLIVTAQIHMGMGDIV